MTTVDRETVTSPRESSPGTVRVFVMDDTEERLVRIEARLTVELGLVDPETLANCLKKQKLDYRKRNTLPRLWKLFRELDVLSADDDERVRALARSRVTPRAGELEEPAAV